MNLPPPSPDVPDSEPPEDTAEPASADHPADRPPTAITILTVDDQLPMLRMIAMLLREIGYRVHEALSGPAALQIARETPEIHLLLTDVDMPEMTGDELVTGFCPLHPTAAFAFISSSPDPMPDGVPHEYLAKPFTAEDLHHTVRRSLQRIRAR